MWAAYRGHLDIVQFLLTEAEPKAQISETYKGNNVLFIAVAGKAIRVARYLLDTYPNLIHSPANDEKVPLGIMAVMSNCVDLLRLLFVEAQPPLNLNEPRFQNRTNLAHAFENDQFESAKFLMSLGAHLDGSIFPLFTDDEQFFKMNWKVNDFKSLCTDVRLLFRIASYERYDDCSSNHYKKDKEYYEKFYYDMNDVERYCVAESILERMGTAINVRFRQDEDTVLHYAMKREIRK